MRYWTAAQEDTAYQLGRKAYGDNVHMDANPFRSPPLRDAWTVGHQAVHDEKVLQDLAPKGTRP